MKTRITSAICHLPFYILLLYTSGLFGQKLLKDTMLHVVKQFQPTIADAYKMNEMPAVKDSVPPIPQLSYFINSKKVFTPFTVENLKPAKMVGEPLTKLYNSLAKIGVGNYNTPYAEIFYNSGRSKDISYGAHLKHFSSSADMEGYGFGGLSDNQIELYGKKFLRKHTVTGNLDYNRNVIHYYGYDTALVHLTDNDYIKQRYSNIGGNVSLQSHYTDSVHLNYLLKLKYYNLTDLYKTSENNINVSGDFSGWVDKQLIHVPLSVDYYKNKFDTLINNNSTVIGLNPHFNYSGDKWSTRLGINLAVDAQQNNNSHFLFYPQIDFNYNVIENIIIPYAGVTGSLKKNSLKSLTDENPFLVPNPTIKNTYSKQTIFPEAYLGIRGSISKTLSYNARTSYSKLVDMPFFINNNSGLSINGFNVLYYDVKLWNVHGELQFQQTEKIKLLAKGDYNKYIMPDESIKPWHRAPLQLTFSANYNLKNKIVLNADIFVVGKRFAYSTTGGSGTNIIVILNYPEELKTIIDANLGIEYRYSKKLSGFLNLNNLGFSRYYMWNNYPSYKFNFLAGVSLIF